MYVTVQDTAQFIVIQGTFCRGIPVKHNMYIRASQSEQLNHQYNATDYGTNQRKDSLHLLQQPYVGGFTVALIMVILGNSITRAVGRSVAKSTPSAFRSIGF